MGKGLLSCKGLKVGWGSGPVLLERVEFEVGPGGRLGLCGGSGLGKSAFLKTLAALIDPVEGEIFYKGKRFPPDNVPSYRRKVVYVSQRPVVLPATVEENLCRPFYYSSLKGKSFPRRLADSWLAKLGFPPQIWARPARELSVGEQQRICLIRAFCLQPEVLLLDEPVSSLDEETAQRVLEILDEVTSGGTAVLMVTHRVGWAGGWCSQVVDLADFAVSRDV